MNENESFFKINQIFGDISKHTAVSGTDTPDSLKNLFDDIAGEKRFCLPNTFVMRVVQLKLMNKSFPILAPYR